MGNAPIYKPYEDFVILLQRNLRQLFIRTQIAIPTRRKHRYLQERRDYEESLKYLLLINASNSGRFLVTPKIRILYIFQSMCFRTVSLGKLNWFISRNTSFSYVIMPTYLYPYVRRNQWFTLNGGEAPILNRTLRQYLSSESP